MKRIILALAALLVVGMATVGALGTKTQQANAAAAPPQCNGEMNGGGTQVACTISVVNYIGANGHLAGTPPSTMTMTRCVGAAGPVSTLTCTTTVATLSQPITSISQCNYSGDGGGGVVRCSVDITNHFAESQGAILAASVYQCVNSVITGPGAPGTCTPANTEGLTAAIQATVGQCNDSGNGGTNVAFICTVSIGSTVATTFPIHINQCNNSGNGGGAVVECSASVTNLAPPGETPTEPTSSTPVGETPTQVPTVGLPGTTPQAQNPPTTVPPTPLVPGTTPQAQNPPTIVPPTPLVPGTTPQAQNPPATPPSESPGTTPQPQVPPSSTPRAPATGEAGPLQGGGTSPLIWVVGLMVASVGLAGLYRTTRVKATSQG